MLKGYKLANSAWSLDDVLLQNLNFKIIHKNKRMGLMKPSYSWYESKFKKGNIMITINNQGFVTFEGSSKSIEKLKNDLEKYNFAFTRGGWIVKSYI